MTPTQQQQAIQDITNIFNSTLAGAGSILPTLANVVPAKLYELKVLAELLNRLAGCSYSFQLSNGASGFKAAPGPINNTFAHIQVLDKQKKQVANIWTDVEFVGLSSYQLSGNTLPSARGEYHELDIVVCDPKLSSGRPRSDQVYIGAECKHWVSIPKKLLREVLGVRRELSFRNTSQGTNPIKCKGLQSVSNSRPDSHMIFAFSTPYLPSDGPLTEWKVPAEQFDIELWQLPV